MHTAVGHQNAILRAHAEEANCSLSQGSLWGTYGLDDRHALADSHFLRGTFSG